MPLYAAPAVAQELENTQGPMKIIIQCCFLFAADHLSARDSHRSHQLRTPRMLSLPSLWPSWPPGSPRMEEKNQNAAAVQAAIATPNAMMGENR